MNKNTINFTLFMKSCLKTHSLRAIFVFSALTAAYGTSQAMNEPTGSSDNKKKQEASLFSTYQKESFNDIVTTTKKGTQKNGKNENENKKTILNTKQSNEMKNLVKNLKFSLNQKEIDYQPNKDVKDEDVIQYVKQYHLLQNIDLSECGYLTDSSIMKIAEICGGTLKEINLKRNCVGGETWTPFTDKTINAISKYCPLVSALNLAGCQVSDQMTIKNLSKLSRLTYLNLGHLLGSTVGDEAIIEIVNKCPATHLNLDTLDITDKTISNIAKKRKLIYLSVDCCYKLTGEGIKLLANCPNLTYLDVFADNVGGALEEISKNCTELTHLKIRSGFLITSSSFEKIAQNCHNLIQFVAFSCKGIKNVAISILAKNNPQLTHFNVSTCDNLGNIGVMTLAKNCPNLEYINLYRCHKLTNPAVEALVKYSHKLKYVNFCGCPKVDQSHIEMLMKSCPELEYLNIAYCSQGNPIDDSIIDTVIKYGKKLKVFMIGGTNITEEGKQQLKDAIPGIEFTASSLI
jgi:F-box and leucine-rich repeat protein 2/20